jgi:hypothetical protein
MAESEIDRSAEVICQGLVATSRHLFSVWIAAMPASGFTCQTQVTGGRPCLKNRNFLYWLVSGGAIQSESYPQRRGVLETR